MAGIPPPPPVAPLPPGAPAWIGSGFFDLFENATLPPDSGMGPTLMSTFGWDVNRRINTLGNVIIDPLPKINADSGALRQVTVGVNDIVQVKNDWFLGQNGVNQAVFDNRGTGFFIIHDTRNPAPNRRLFEAYGVLASMNFSLLSLREQMAVYHDYINCLIWLWNFGVFINNRYRMVDIITGDPIDIDQANLTHARDVTFNIIMNSQLLPGLNPNRYQFCMVRTGTRAADFLALVGIPNFPQNLRNIFTAIRDTQNPLTVPIQNIQTGLNQIIGYFQRPTNVANYTALNLDLAAQQNPLVAEQIALAEQAKERAKRKLAGELRLNVIQDPFTMEIGDQNAYNQAVDAFGNRYVPTSTPAEDPTFEQTPNRAYQKMAQEKATIFGQMAEDAYAYQGVNRPGSEIKTQDNKRSRKDDLEVTKWLQERAQKRIDDVWHSIDKETHTHFHNIEPPKVGFHKTGFYYGWDDNDLNVGKENNSLVEKMLFES